MLEDVSSYAVRASNDTRLSAGTSVTYARILRCHLTLATNQRLFELVARADLCGPTPTLVDPGIVDRESPIGKSVDGRVMGGNK